MPTTSTMSQASTAPLHEEDHHPGQQVFCSASSPGLGCAAHSRAPPNRRLRSSPALLATTLVAGLLLVLVVAQNTLPLQPSSIRHPLNLPKLRQRRLGGGSSVSNNINNKRDWRVLTLGGPSMWGAGLATDQLEGTAFPYRLSPLVHNAAHWQDDQQAATLASLCTQSILSSAQRQQQQQQQQQQQGDDKEEEDIVYDAIVLDFPYAMEQQRASLNLLAHRLRKRYPASRMVFLDLTPPANRLDQRRQSPFPNYIVQAVQGQVLVVTGDEQPLWFQTTGDDSQSMVLSAQGHEHVARGIQTLLDNDALWSTSDLDYQHPLGDWGSGDSCRIWYETNQLPRNYQGFRPVRIATSSDGEDIKSSTTKYAMEVPREGGTVTLTNTLSFTTTSLSDSRMLYATYLATSPEAAANKVYPRVRIEVNGEDTVVLDPNRVETTNEQSSSHILHHTRTTAIGRVPADLLSGVEIRFDPMEETLLPFRLVGLSILPEERKAFGVSAEEGLAPIPLYIPNDSIGRDLDVW